MPRLRGRTRPGGSSRCRAFAGGRGNGRMGGSSRCRAFAGGRRRARGRVGALSAERSRQNAAVRAFGEEDTAVDGDGMRRVGSGRTRPSVRGRTQPWTGTGGSSGCRDFAGGRGRVGALGPRCRAFAGGRGNGRMGGSSRCRAFAGGRRRARGRVGALSAERSRQNAAVRAFGEEDAAVDGDGMRRVGSGRTRP